MSKCMKLLYGSCSYLYKPIVEWKYLKGFLSSMFQPHYLTGYTDYSCVNNKYHFFFRYQNLVFLCIKMQPLTKLIHYKIFSLFENIFIKIG